MNLSGITLIIPDKEDVERDAVASAWESCDGTVLRLGRFWSPPSGLDPRRVKVYGNDSFCLVLAQKTGLSLISPPDDLIRDLDRKWTRRDVTIRTLGDMGVADFPAFIKPVVPKLFTARIYTRISDLETECRGLGVRRGELLLGSRTQRMRSGESASGHRGGDGGGPHGNVVHRQGSRHDLAGHHTGTEEPVYRRADAAPSLGARFRRTG